MADWLGADDLDAITLGAPILGTGGGGDPYLGRVIARRALGESGRIRLVPLQEIPDNWLVVASAMMGAPTVFVEKVPNGREPAAAFQALEEHLGRKADATYSIEAGGLNSTIPIGTAARLDLPLLDADGMGRAFPEIQMVSPSIYGYPATPMALADEKGNTLIIRRSRSNLWTERFARHATIDMGGSAMIALYPLQGWQAKRALIGGSISLARTIGSRLQDAWNSKSDPIEAILRATRGQKLFQGKISDVERRSESGFARGVVVLRGTGPFGKHNLVIRFQNENIVAELDGRRVVAVPDLISVVDSETGAPVTTEGLRFGLRVTVITMPCHPKWRTPRGLELVGPDYFGYPSESVRANPSRGSAP